MAIQLWEGATDGSDSRLSQLECSFLLFSELFPLDKLSILQLLCRWILVLRAAKRFLPFFVSSIADRRFPRPENGCC